MVETRPKLTEDEFMAMPDNGRKYELVDGEPKEVPTGGMHGDIAVTLILMLGSIARQLGRLFDSGTGFRMAGGNVRSPDVAFMQRDRLPNGIAPLGFIDGAPDLAIEIISESEDRSDAARKIVEYFESGAQQVWTVQPLTQSVTVYHSLDRVRTWEAHEELTGGDLLPGFHCQVAEIFAA